MPVQSTSPSADDTSPICGTDKAPRIDYGPLHGKPSEFRGGFYCEGVLSGVGNLK